MKNLTLLKQLFDLEKKAEKHLNSLPSNWADAVLKCEYSEYMYKQLNMLKTSYFKGYEDVVEWVLFEWSPENSLIVIDDVEYVVDTEEKLWEHMEKVEGWKYV